MQYSKMQNGNELYFFIFILKASDECTTNEGELKENITKLKTEEIKTLGLYKSFRIHSDFIIWITSDNLDSFIAIKNQIKEFSFKYSLNLVDSYLSIYERSPYLKNSLHIEDQIKNSTRKYLIFYPMSKSNDWYLLPYEERKRIMDDHIRVAMSDENNKDILSYTTYSFGIGDQEFVVYYETDNLYSWMKITQRLREVEARKWITLETPIYVGIRI